MPATKASESRPLAGPRFKGLHSLSLRAAMGHVCNPRVNRSRNRPSAIASVVTNRCAASRGERKEGIVAQRAAFVDSHGRGARRLVLGHGRVGGPRRVGARLWPPVPLDRGHGRNLQGIDLRRMWGEVATPNRKRRADRRPALRSRESGCGHSGGLACDAGRRRQPRPPALLIGKFTSRAFPSLQRPKPATS
jgi:hypothetical protein